MGDGHVSDHADDEWGMGLDVGREGEQVVEFVNGIQTLGGMELPLSQVATAEGLRRGEGSTSGYSFDRAVCQ